MVHLMDMVHIKSVNRGSHVTHAPKKEHFDELWDRTLFALTKFKLVL
jgi:hypothetical protein